MTKTLALLLDSYRELNAKRLFWIVLLISGLVVLAFAMVGISGDTITILWWKTPLHSDLLTYLDPAFLYKSMFTAFGVDFWLAWLANILALISTAGIFPDFLADGAVDLYLSKPISRPRLFMTKYLGGLLFVTLQVTIFSACSFFVLGLRGKLWAPSVFIAIPLVVLVFSYLFSICVLLGVLTRSTVAALMLTLLIWFGLWSVQKVEDFLLQQTIGADYQAVSLDRRIAQAKLDLRNFSVSKPTTGPVDNSSWRNVFPFRLIAGPHPRADLQVRLEQLETQRRQMTGTIKTAHSVTYDVLTLLPKTSGTTRLLNRILMTDADRAGQDANVPPPNPDFSEERGRGPGGWHWREYLANQAQKIEDKRPVWWVLGTSIVFEFVMIGVAGWIFCRRDY